jgi:hypothetical protein
MGVGGCAQPCCVGINPKKKLKKKKEKKKRKGREKKHEPFPFLYTYRSCGVIQFSCFLKYLSWSRFKPSTPKQWLSRPWPVTRRSFT